jgi:threonine dehydrogenase-like Zn-dependent dehydrogenase
MRALCWHGKADIRCDTVPDPRIEAPRDAIVKVTSCAICGSDLHLYDGLMPGMESGDIMGHEFMGEVVEVGRENTKLKVGDRVVVPFTIICGECEQCRRGNYSACEQSQQGDGGQGLRPHHGGPLRLRPSHRRLSWGAGGIRARALRRCRPGQGPERAQRRAGAVPQ